MTDILYEQQGPLSFITLNRPAKHNAFDDQILLSLQAALDKAIADEQIRVIILKANGKHFSAGADIAWMQGMVELSEAENLADAMVLAKLMYSLYQSPKPTIASVQGAAYGGGVGLIAACDIAIAADSARFCFSEVTLGLIPAVISPYIVKAIGERLSKSLFMSAEAIDAAQAKTYNLIQHSVAEELLDSFTLDYAQRIAAMPAEAVIACKSLVDQVAAQPITEELLYQTAALIAKKRVSAEGQRGLRAFITKGTK